MRRIDKNRDIYETWPIETRQAVLDGKAEPGMTPEMVRVALGEPTEINRRSNDPNDPNDEEVWIYRTGGITNDPMMGAGYPSGYPGGYPGSYPGGMGGGYPGTYPSGGGIVLAPGRGGGVGIIPPSVGVGIGGGGGIGIGGGGGGGIGGMGAPMPVTRTPVEEREVVFRNGVVLRADPPPEEPK